MYSDSSALGFFLTRWRLIITVLAAGAIGIYGWYIRSRFSDYVEAKGTVSAATQCIELGSGDYLCQMLSITFSPEGSTVIQTANFSKEVVATIPKVGDALIIYYKRSDPKNVRMSNPSGYRGLGTIFIVIAVIAILFAIFAFYVARSFSGAPALAGVFGASRLF